MNDFFRRFSAQVSNLVGTPLAFLLAILVILLWALSGPFFGFSDTWQLVINTGTTIVTFLMVFLIQNTQNREMKAIHLKLDELIRSHESARNSLVDLESLSDEELDQLQTEFSRFREHHQKLGEELIEQLDEVQEALEGKQSLDHSNSEGSQ